MANVKPFEDGKRNISQIADLLQKDRGTIRKVIKSNQIPPQGKRKGNDVYFVSDVAEALFSGAGSTAEQLQDINPKTPREFKEKYQGLKEKLEYEVATREYIHEEEVTEAIAKIYEKMKIEVSSYVDYQERKGSIPKELIDPMNDLCDGLLRHLAVSMSE